MNSTNIFTRVASAARSTAAATVIGAAVLSALTGTAVAVAGSASATSATDVQFVEAIHQAGIRVEAQSAITVAHNVCGFLGQGATPKDIRSEVIATNSMSQDAATTFIVYAVQAYCPQYIKATDNPPAPKSPVPYRIPENEAPNSQVPYRIPENEAPTSRVDSGLYGNPQAAARFWQHQNYDDCWLMAAASVIGEITGRLPSENEMLARAARLGKADPKNAGGSDVEIVEVLKSFGITPYLTYESREQQTGVPTGLPEIARYLAQGRKVLVGLDADTLNGTDGDRSTADHEVVVTGVDTAKGIVHLNDSGDPNGSNKQVPVRTFMQAWSTDDYSTIVTQEAA